MSRFFFAHLFLYHADIWGMPKTTLHQWANAYNYYRKHRSSDWSSLHKAASCNYKTKIDELVSDRQLLNQADKLGSTPLHIAVNFSHEAAVRRLLRAGADVNYGDNMGHSALHLAVTKNNLKLVKLLLKHGAEVNARAHNLQTQIDNTTPLHLAVLYNRYDITECLLAAGAMVNARDGLQQCPLHFAIMMDNSKIINLLINYHADCNALTQNHISPLLMAEARNDQQLEAILRKAGACEEDKDVFERFKERGHLCA